MSKLLMMTVAACMLITSCSPAVEEVFIEEEVIMTVEAPPVVEEPEEEIPTYQVALSEELQKYTYGLCVDYDIVEHYTLVLAIMWQESSFNPATISATNDYGIMQINVVNHAWLSKELGIVDFLDAEQSILAGVHMIANLLHKYEDVHKALMAYNFGEGGAAKVWSQGIYSSRYSRSIADKKEAIEK